MASKYELDMSQGSIFKNIIKFAIPVMFAGILQLLFNAADLIVVSNWSGNDAMAAVGSTGSLNNLLINLFIGISLGAGVLVSRCYGAHDTAGVFRAVHTSMLMSAVMGVIAMVIGLLFSAPLLEIMGTPEGPVLEGATLYMKIVFLSAPASVVFNFGASILRAVGDTKRPLYILSLSGVVNIILNLVLVIAFNLGVAGVAIATSVSNYLSMTLVLFALMHDDGEYRLHLKELHFYKKETIDVLKIGLPSGLQSTVFSLSNTVIQSAVNSFGEGAINGCAAASSIEGFVYTSMNSFYQASLTAVSQNYGAKNEKRINKSILISLLCVFTVGLTVGSLVVFFARPLLSIYIHDFPEAMEYGVKRMIYSCIPYFLCGIMEVLTGALRGLGYSTITAVNSLVGACGFRIFWIFVVLSRYRVPDVLFMAWPLSWLTVVLMHTACLLVLKKKAIKKMYEM